jgi:HAMP domain-containing protein
MRLQLLLGAGSVTLLLAVGLFAILPWQLDALGRDSMEEQAFALVNLVADMSGVDLVVVKSFDDPSYLKEALAPVQSMRQVRTAAIYEPSGRILVRQRNNVSVPVPIEFPVPSEETGLQWGKTDLIVWKKVRDGKGEELGLVVLNVSLERLNAVRAQNLRTATVLTGSMGGALLIGLLLLGSRLTGPVVRLTAVADHVAAGRLEAISVPTETGGVSANELNRLTGAFYTMLSRLQKSQEAL